MFNLYAKPFTWSKPISGPVRVQTASTPGHRRRKVEDGGFTISPKHMIRQELEGVELYDVEDDDVARSLELHDLEDFKVRVQRRPSAKLKNGLDSLGSSSSRVSISPESLKGTSTGTMSTLSTLDGEEVNRLVEPQDRGPKK